MFTEHDDSDVQLLVELKYRQSDMLYRWARDVSTLGDDMITECPHTTVQSSIVRLSTELQAIAGRIRDVARRAEV